MRVLLTLLLASLPTAYLVAGATETCFSNGKDKTDGLNKICYYKCPSGEAAITVKSYQVCPVTIKR